MTKEYYDGVLEGLYRYAWMKDGVYYVGSCGQTLKEAQADVEKERAAETVESAPKAPNIASTPCLCLSCSRLLSTGGTCDPNTNSHVTACGGYIVYENRV
jgi:hypothetical protein